MSNLVLYPYTVSPMRRGWRVLCVRSCGGVVMPPLVVVACPWVAWGWYLPGKIGTRSLIGLPKRHMAGESFVAGSGVFRYWRMASMSIKVTAAANIASDQSLGTALQHMGKCYGAKTMVDSPGPYELLLSAVGDKFWPAI